MNATGEGKLVIVPTPLGNLGDMTARSLKALRAADVVCAEDTRVTGKLLAAFDIEKRLERLDEALIGARAEGVVERVLSGEVIAYCSDAGMPCVSDRGFAAWYPPHAPRARRWRFCPGPWRRRRRMSPAVAPTRVSTSAAFSAKGRGAARRARKLARARRGAHLLRKPQSHRRRVGVGGGRRFRCARWRYAAS